MFRSLAQRLARSAGSASVLQTFCSLQQGCSGNFALVAAPFLALSRRAVGNRSGTLCRTDTAMPTLMFNKDGMASNTCNYLAGQLGEMVVDALLTGSGRRRPCTPEPTRSMPHQQSARSTAIVSQSLSNSGSQ
jgi:hypothetical protein